MVSRILSKIEVYTDEQHILYGSIKWKTLSSHCVFLSLKQVEDDAVIKTLCMDDAAFDLLHQMNFPHVDLVHVRELETPELLEIKRNEMIRNIAGH